MNFILETSRFRWPGLGLPGGILNQCYPNYVRTSPKTGMAIPVVNIECFADLSPEIVSAWYIVQDSLLRFVCSGQHVFNTSYRTKKLGKTYSTYIFYAQCASGTEGRHQSQCSILGISRIYCSCASGVYVFSSFWPYRKYKSFNPKA